MRIMESLQDDINDALGMGKKYYGKYRAVVSNNVDPMQMGRIQVLCPDVSGSLPTTWAMPCVPLTGRQAGTFFVPTVGTGVWVEFEQGDPDYPIYVGGFWGASSELPDAAKAGLPVSPNIVLQTPGQNSIVLSDVPGPTGGIVLKIKSGASLEITDAGITIKNGKGATISLTGNTVSVNDGALTVM